MSDVKSSLGSISGWFGSSVLMLLLAAYSVCYFSCGETADHDWRRTFHQYNNTAIAVLFIPAAWVESVVTGKPVTVLATHRSYGPGFDSMETLDFTFTAGSLGE